MRTVEMDGELHMRLPSTERRALERAAESRGATCTTLARKIIRDWLREHSNENREAAR